MRNVKLWLKNLFYPTIIILLAGFIAWTNYTPGTFFSGWDTLHPEFNFSLYLRRVFFGVWQEHQGVGALASQSHISEISRIPVLYALNLLLPIHLVRYAFFSLTLILGALGVYFAFLSFVKEDKFYARLSAFSGSLFYLLNLYTVQQFYVPLEMFAVYFAVVPWLFYSLVRFLQSGRKKNLLIFAVISFFGSSMAHTPTLFYTFSLCFLAFFVVFFVLDFSKATFLRLFSAGLIYLTVNLYWLLPNFYFVLNGGVEIVEKSRIHLNFTPEAFLQSKAYGDIKDIVLGKNFLFNWREFSFEDNTFVDLMDEWNLHLSTTGVEKIGIFLFIICVLGIILSFIRKNKILISLSLTFFISFLFLINENPPLEPFFVFLIDKYPTLGEALRFPFTKFSFTYTFPLSIYLSFFLFSLFDSLSLLNIRYKLIKFSLYLLSFSFLFFVLSGMIYYSLPVFRGFLISPSMKVSIPREYFEVFDWFSKNADDNARIVKLPLWTHWGWGFYEWGYQGAGFTWFGLKQPTFDREFDRWSSYNESFYNEASSALYKYHLISPDKVRPCQTKKGCETEERLEKEVEEWNREVIREFEKVLAKYDVSYLLLDESIINAGGDAKLLYLNQIKDLVAKSSSIKQVAQFGFLTIYRFVPLTRSVLVKPVLVDADLTYSKYDPVYQKYGEYITKTEATNSLLPPAISFPFVNFDSRGEVSFKIEDGRLIIENKAKKAKVILPIGDEVVKEKFGEGQGFDEGYNCDLKKKGRVVKTRLDNGNFYGAYEGGASCDWFYYPTLDRSRAWLLRIKGKNLAGRGLKIYLQNLRTGRMDLEELLKPGKNGEFDSYFVVYPSESAGLYKYTTDFENTPEGYTLNVETRSFGKISSENIIEDITFIPIDIDWFSRLKNTLEEPRKMLANASVLESKKYGTFAYKFKLGESREDRLLTISQGFDKGWVAFALKDGKVNYFEHIRVNGWKNGWIIPASESNVFVFFWPQSLQWLGFLLLGFSFLGVAVAGFRHQKVYRGKVST